MHSHSFHVFLSAVTAEFGSERVELERWLERKGLHVASQEKFNQHGGTLWQKLHDEAASCRAAICLVGVEPGSLAPAAGVGGVPVGAPLRTYTQWEFWLAWGELPWSPQRIPAYVFLPADLQERQRKAREAAAGDPERLRLLDLQEAHVRALKATNVHWSPFADLHDLVKMALTLDLPTLRQDRPSNLPSTIGTLFKGREEFLQQVQERLARGDSQVVIRQNLAIHGTGGVGKTRVAVEFAYRHAEEYTALLFVTADTQENLRRSLATLCGPLVLDLPEQNAREEEAQVAAVLGWLREHPGWFLILDNVDTRAAADEAQRLLASLTTGQIVVTTRMADWRAGVTPLELDVLSEDAAVEFLLERTPHRVRTAADEADARTLAKELDGLALEQAGAFVDRRRLTLGSYLRRWRDHDTTVREWFDEHLMQYPRGVATTWFATMDQLSPEALALLRIFSWPAPDPIPRSLAVENEEEALADLFGFSLAKLDGENLQVHRLVQEVTRDRQGQQEQEASLKEALSRINTAFEGDPLDVRSWPALEPLRPHVGALVGYADAHSIVDPTTRLMNQLGQLLDARANFEEAEPLMRRALNIDEHSLGPQHPDVAILLNNLASLLQDTNRLEEAEPLMRRAVAIFLQFMRATGHPHPHMQVIINNYRWLLMAMGQSREEADAAIRDLAPELFPEEPNNADKT